MYFGTSKKIWPKIKLHWTAILKLHLLKTNEGFHNGQLFFYLPQIKEVVLVFIAYSLLRESGSCSYQCQRPAKNS